MSPPIVLSIAGFDPSSGAGITADIKTIAAHGCYGTSCITALTVQSTRGVRTVFAPPADLVAATLRELTADLPPRGVRIGMLGSGLVAEVVADYVKENPPAWVVLDPILRSSSGAELLDGHGLAVVRGRLLPNAHVLTPNLDEAAALTGLTVDTAEDMKAAAAVLHRLGAKAVVIKGGHLPGNEALDLLSVSANGSSYEREFRGRKFATGATHGTGCAFATALACNLALGRELPQAVAAAKQFVTTAMVRAYKVGSGPGPMHHLYRLDER
jgi:hydroxymethylpyrimidine/phosphomethylpyrimidine kinase